MADKTRLDDIYENAMSGNNNPSNTYYDMARRQQYTDLLDSEIQLENAKYNAMKNTQNNLNSMGLMSTGYGSTVNSGIENAYANAIANVRNNTQTNINNLNMQQAQQQYEQSQKDETSNENAFRTLSSLIANASNENALNDLLANYGYGSYDEKKENFILNGEKPENMSNEDWAQLQYIYNEQVRNIRENETPNYPVYSNFDELSASTYRDNSGKYSYTLGQTFKDQINHLWGLTTFGTFNSGDMIKLISNNNNEAYLIFTGNGFRPLTKAQYDEMIKDTDNDSYSFKGNDVYKNNEIVTGN